MAPARDCEPVIIDGSHGEGGGQILKTSLALSAILQRPMLIEQIRAGRPKPGLAAQHLTAILASQKICAAEVTGAKLHSIRLTFRPILPPTPGEYRFDVAEAMGLRGRSSEAVADAAVAVLESHIRSGPALDIHLADQALLPLAFARGPSTFTCPSATRHLHANAWVIEQFGIASIWIDSAPGSPTRVTMLPKL